MKADGDNVIFTLKGGNADFPYVLGEHRLSIMPATDNGDVDWQSGIGTGPYMLEEFKPGQVTRAKRNPELLPRHLVRQCGDLFDHRSDGADQRASLRPARRHGSLRPQDPASSCSRSRASDRQGDGL